jgi:DNA gyrase subunit A
LNVTEKTGALISILNVTDEDDLMIINRSGITIRSAVSELRVMGRATQGVRLIQLRGDDQIASVCPVPKSEDEPEVAVDGSEEGGSAGEMPTAEEGTPDAGE